MKITDYLAIYASCLSTMGFLWSILQSRAKLKVDLIFGIEGGEKPKSGVYVCIRNLSSHDIHLSNISILYPYKKITIYERAQHAFRYRRLPVRIGWVSSSLSNYSIDDGCPVCIGPRQSHKVLIKTEILEKIFTEASRRILIGSAQDQLWQNAYSKPFKLWQNQT